MAGITALILGPSGAGKSSLLRSALEVEGSGMVLLAPGSVELNSYAGYANREGYYIKGFDDPGFLPTIGKRDTEGFALALTTLVALRSKLLEEPGKYRVLGVDTISGFAQLAVNMMLKRCRLDDAPAAQSPEGAQYYVGIKNLMNELMRALMACRDLGCHLIVTSHVSEKDVASTSMAEAGGSAHVPLIPGAFREQLPGLFDLVMYAGVNKAGRTVDGRNDPLNPRHYVQWVPDNRKPSKSRLGSLGSQLALPNEWGVIKPLAERALKAQAAAGGPAPSAIKQAANGGA